MSCYSNRDGADFSLLIVVAPGKCAQIGVSSMLAVIDR